MGFLSFIPFVGPALDAAVGLINQNSVNKNNRRINRENNQFNHDEAVLAFERQRQLINEQNEYNSYSNIRGRMEDAGLNPARMFGESSAGVSNSSSSVNAPSASAASPIAMQAAKINLAQDMANLEMTRAQTGLIDAQAKEIAPNAASQRALNDSVIALNEENKNNISWLNKEFERTIDERVKAWVNANLKDRSQIDLFNAQAQSVRDMLGMSKQRFEYDMENRWKYEVELLKRELRVKDATAMSLVSNYHYNMAMTSVAHAQETLTKATASKTYYDSLSSRAMASYNFNVYGNSSYQRNVRLLQFANYNLTRYKAESERFGYPYQKVVPYSISQGGSFFGLGASTSRSGAQLINPVNIGSVNAFSQPIPNLPLGY